MTLRRILFLCGLLTFALVAVAPRLPGSLGIAHASGDLGQLSGNAWSDTVGWISFNNTIVSVASDGTLSGYAWSDHIGWVSFHASDLTGCPSGPCPAKIAGTALQGWAKALAANGNGWDGWISLSNTGVSLPGGTGASGPFAGTAWGSTVVGWVSFSGVNFVAVAPPAATISVTASPTKVRKNTTSQLIWTGSSLPTSCTVTRSPASAGYPQSVIGTATGGTVPTDAITQNTVFTVTCGSASGQASVGVLATFIEI